MDKVQITLTVLFDGTFWLGIFERVSGGELEVAKVTFYTEPREIELYHFVLYQYRTLNFCKSVLVESKVGGCVSPKRRKRLAKKQVVKEIGTKSQQALKMQTCLNKEMRNKISREKKREFERRKFEIRQKKRLEKHKGR